MLVFCQKLHIVHITDNFFSVTGHSLETPGSCRPSCRRAELYTLAASMLPWWVSLSIRRGVKSLLLTLGYTVRRTLFHDDVMLELDE